MLRMRASSRFEKYRYGFGNRPGAATAKLTLTRVKPALTQATDDAGTGGARVLIYPKAAGTDAQPSGRAWAFAKEASVLVDPLPTGPTATNEFGIRLQPALGQVDALVLFFLGDPDTEYGLDHGPDHK